MKRTANIAFCLLIALILLAPLFLTNTEEGTVSDADNRVLKSRSVFGVGEYTSDVEIWFKERLWLRDAIVKAYEVSNDRVFGELTNATYQYGKDGYTFVKIHSNIEYGDYHKKFAETVANMQKYCESRGTKFYYVFNPEKESVYKKFLPAGVNYNDRWADKMLAYMSEMGVNYIDLRDAMNKLRYDENVFNKKYDAGHWNQNGAFYGMKELTERIHKDIPKVMVLSKSEYEVTTMKTEKINGSNQKIIDEVPQYTLKTAYSDITGAFKDELERNKTFSYFQLIKNDSEKANGIKTMLLFEDDLYAPFAFARAEKTAVVNCLQNAINFDYYYNIFKPDVVVFENMESSIADRYFSQTGMEAADYAPAILGNFPESDFQERKASLLERSDGKYSSASAILIPGKAVDKVFISNGFGNTSYAYLITDDRVIDLRNNGNGALYASIRHGDLEEGTYVVLYILNEKKEGRYAYIPVKSGVHNIAHRRGRSDNVVFDRANNRFIMTGSSEGDAFRNTALQLYNEDGTEFIETINVSSDEGAIEGVYCHRLPTGIYTMMLKSFRNTSGERAVFKVPLTEWKTYWFTYNVDELSDIRAEISGFGFLKH